MIWRGPPSIIFIIASEVAGREIEDTPSVSACASRRIK